MTAKPGPTAVLDDGAGTLAMVGGEAGVVELAEASTLTQPAITEHLKVPERAGLIGRARDGQRRPARPQLEGLSPVDDWLGRAFS
ncbi:MAG: ArsR/SmtB family transcription factor [Acidimicrobiales bacterium]